MNSDFPWWIKLGFPVLVAAYLLGMIPGIASPIDRIQIAIHEHDVNNAHVLRAICRAVWRDVPSEQRACDE